MEINDKSGDAGRFVIENNNKLVSTYVKWNAFLNNYCSHSACLVIECGI